MGDLVPYDQRGKYFGKRTKIMSLSSFAALLIGGMILNATSRTSFPSSGFIIIFMTAALFRWISFLFLRMMEEPEVDLRESRFHLGDFYRHFKNSNFLVFVVYSALISFSVQVAGPFFSVYMLHDLGFSYLQYMIVIGSAVLSQYLTYVYWGNFSDRFGNRMVLKITGLLMPLLPLLWLISSNFYYIIGVQLFAGFVWAGFSLSVSIFVFDAVASEQRAVCIAVYSTLNALGIFLGAMTGGLFTKIFPDSFSILHFQFHLKSNLICLFLISGILRILVYLTFLPKIQEVREVEVFTLKEAFQKTVR